MVANLVADIEERGFHLNTGCLGVVVLLPVLTAYGHADVAAKVALQRTYPSWGYWFDQGADTMWEMWETDTRSRNHYFQGTVAQWLLENVAGVRNLSNGWERILVRPDGREQVDSAALRTDTVRGRVAVSWRRVGRVFQLEVQVPVGSTAEVHVPSAAVSDVTAVPAPFAGEPVFADGYTVYTVPSGALELHVADFVAAVLEVQPTFVNIRSWQIRPSRVGARLELGDRAPVGSRRPAVVLVAQQRFGGADLQHPLRVILPVRCQVQPSARGQPRGQQRDERRRDQPPLVVPLLRPRIREEHPYSGQRVRRQVVAQEVERVAVQQPDVVQLVLLHPQHQLPEPGRVHLGRQVIDLRRLRSQLRRRIPHPRPDLQHHRRFPPEPARQIDVTSRQILELPPQLTPVSIPNPLLPSRHPNTPPDMAEHPRLPDLIHRLHRPILCEPKHRLPRRPLSPARTAARPSRLDEPGGWASDVRTTGRTAFSVRLDRLGRRGG